MTIMKFCGMTREADVAHACELGVQAIGIVLWPKSPRFVDRARAASLVKQLPDEVTAVGVLVDPSADDVEAAVQSGFDVVQIHGSMPDLDRAPSGAPQIWIARALESDLTAVTGDLTLVLDAHDPVRHGGTGRTIDWARAATIAAERKVVLAGGLTARNVAAAIRQVRPFGVDVASGIEDGPGIKNAQAMAAFAAAVREADL
jgi:phosphoribosylanthranilate isomerase